MKLYCDTTMLNQIPADQQTSTQTFPYPYLTKLKTNRED